MKRAVVTGLGVVAPSGIGVEPHWRSTVEGRVCVRPVERYDASGYSSCLVGEVRGFDVAEHIDDRLIVQTDRWTHFSLAATRMALDDAKYDPATRDPYETSVVLASGSGGNEFGQHEIEALWQHGRTGVSAYQSIAWFYAASVGQTSILHGTKGPAGVFVSDGAGGLDSLGHARRAIRRGTPAVLAGGTEAPLSPYALLCQIAQGRLTRSRNPHTGYQPFDVHANGYAPGEGGAVLLLEDSGTALERGVEQVYGEILGYAATHDAYHFEDPAPDCRHLARAIAKALTDAGLGPSDVDAIVADGAGTPDRDALEVAAIHEVFGERAGRVPVTAPSGLVGRLHAGGAALNSVTALLALRDNLLPASGNLRTPNPAYGLDFVREPRELPLDVVLVVARGHGGFNSAVVLRRFR